MRMKVKQKNLNIVKTKPNLKGLSALAVGAGVPASEVVLLN